MKVAEIQKNEGELCWGPGGEAAVIQVVGRAGQAGNPHLTVLLGCVIASPHQRAATKGECVGAWSVQGRGMAVGAVGAGGQGCGGDWRPGGP